MGGWSTRWERLRVFAIERAPELSENLELHARISTKSYKMMELQEMIKDGCRHTILWFKYSGWLLCAYNC